MNKQPIVLLFFLAVGVAAYAQNDMRIHYKDGTQVDIDVTTIDSITFGHKAVPAEQVTLTGTWLWGSQEKGYYELLTMNADKTYTGYDNYFTYGFNTMTYGFYAQYGTLLTLWSNGYGYQNRYTWFVTGLSANALSVMTQMGPFTYYRLQPEVIRLQVGQTLSCTDGDAFVFADGVVAQVADGGITALASGTTYVQKLLSTTNRIVAYQLVVE